MSKPRTLSMTSEEMQEVLEDVAAPVVRRYPEWHVWAKTRPEPAWLIDRILPARGVTFLTGVPKLAKKSFLAFDLCAAVATGRAIGSVTPSGAHPVLYLYMEDTERDVADRHDQLAAGEGFQIAELENLHFLHAQGFSLESTHDIRWVQVYVQTHGIKLVVLDTLNKVWGGDENKADEIGKVLNFGKVLGDYFDCATLFVHHMRKGESSHLGNKPTPNEDVRGSTAIIGAVNQHLALRFYASNPYQLYLGAIGKKYQNWYEVHWKGNTPKDPPGAPTSVRLEPCDEPEAEVELQY